MLGVRCFISLNKEKHWFPVFFRDGTVRFRVRFFSLPDSEFKIHSTKQVLPEPRISESWTLKYIEIPGWGVSVFPWGKMERFLGGNLGVFSHQNGVLSKSKCEIWEISMNFDYVGFIYHLSTAFLTIW